MQFRAGDEDGRLHTQHVGQPGQGLFFIVCGHMGHECQVLDQATALALGRVSRAQHPPLAGLQGTRPAHLHSTSSSQVMCLLRTDCCWN